MRKGFNTLSEQMGRMKSLFTEERLFGNLVEQKVGQPEILEDLDLSRNECAKFINDSYSEVIEDKGEDKWDKKNDKKVIWCVLKYYDNNNDDNNDNIGSKISKSVSKFVSNFDKSGKANKLMDILNISTYNKKLTGEEEKPAKEKKWIPIKTDDGIVRMFIQDLKDGTYKFKSKLKDDVISLSSGTKRSPQFKTIVEPLILKQLPENSNITILKALNLKGYDYGKFKVTKRTPNGE
jgi:hypothetical protein